MQTFKSSLDVLGTFAKLEKYSTHVSQIRLCEYLEELFVSEISKSYEIQGSKLATEKGLIQNKEISIQKYVMPLNFAIKR